MSGRKYLEINDSGNLCIAGCDLVKLADEYGTPLYVVNEDEIRRRCRRIKEGFLYKYNGAKALYASKVFSCISVYKIINEEGLGIDVVSGGEIYTAKKAGFPMEKTYFHGNNKTWDEICYAVDSGVGYFVIDSFYEMELIQRACEKRGNKVNALLRISPGVSPETHRYISTGQMDSKFGFSIKTGMAFEAVKKIRDYPNIKLMGFHNHIGSNIFNPQSYIEAVDVMMAFIYDVKKEFGFIIKELNMGGGFGVYNKEKKEMVDILDFTDVIMKRVISKANELDIEVPVVIIEPGRWLMQESGLTLYSIGAIKNIEGIRKYISIDGGMTDNPRPALYQAAYEAAVANKANIKPCEKVTIAGKCCESGDILIKDLKVPKIQSGDTLAVFGTGAYNYSMSSNYNRNTRPAVVMLCAGIPRLIIKRESYEDLIRNECF